MSDKIFGGILHDGKVLKVVGAKGQKGDKGDKGERGSDGADRTPESGMAYKVLVPESPLNEQMTSESTIYEVRENYNLGDETLSVPSGCTLFFNGGIIDGGEIVLDNTSIIGNKAFGENVTLSGTTPDTLKTSILVGTEAGEKVNKLYAVTNSVEIDENLSSTTTILLRAGRTLEGGNHLLTHNSNVPAILVSGKSKLRNLRITTYVNDDTPVIKMDTSSSTGNQNVVNTGIMSDITIISNTKTRGIGIYAEGGITAHGVLCYHRFERINLHYLNYGIRLEVGNTFDTTSWMNGNVFDSIFIYSCKYGIYLNSATSRNIDGNKFKNVEIQWSNTYCTKNIYMNGCSENILDVMHWDCSGWEAFLLTDSTRGNLIISNKTYKNTDNQFINGRALVNQGNFCTTAQYNNYQNTIINEKPYFNGRQTNLLENASLFYNVSVTLDTGFTMTGIIDDIFKNNYNYIVLSNTSQTTGVARIRIDFGEVITFDDFSAVWTGAAYPNEVRIYGVTGSVETLLYGKTGINKKTIPIIRTWEIDAAKAPTGNALIFEFTLVPGGWTRLQHLAAAGYKQHAFVEVGTPMETDLSFEKYKGIVLKSENGTLYKLGVSDAGVISTREWHNDSVDVMYSTDVVLSNEDARKGSSFSTELSSSYGIGAVTVYMNGENITASCWDSNTSTVTIPNVTNTIRIDCVLNKVITFVDSTVKDICVANWGGSYVENEITEYEAAQVTSLGTVFKGNTSITSFNELQYFTGLTTLKEAFRTCTNLQSVTLPKTSRMTSMYDAFLTCSSLSGTLDLTPLNGSSITSMESACRRLGSISKIILPKCTTVTSMYFTFYKETNEANTLTEIDSSLCSWANVTSNLNNTFVNLRGLTKITGGLPGLTRSVSLSYSPITHDNAVEILESLGTTSGATLTFSTTTYSTLTDEEKQIAIDKGWTIGGAS